MESRKLHLLYKRPRLVSPGPDVSVTDPHMTSSVTRPNFRASDAVKVSRLALCQASNLRIAPAQPCLVPSDGGGSETPDSSMSSSLHIANRPADSRAHQIPSRRRTHNHR